MGDTAAAAELDRATAAAAASTSLPFPLPPCSFSSSSFPFQPDFVHFLYQPPGPYGNEKLGKPRVGPAVGAGFGPGACLPKRKPGADPGRSCRREEEGGDGKPVSGRLRQALTASSPETAANSAVELWGPRQATGTRPYPVNRTGAVGRQRARVCAGGGSRSCEKVPRPHFSSPPEPCGAGGGAKAGRTAVKGMGGGVLG